MKFIIFVSLLFALSGCTTLKEPLETWRSLNKEKREYEVKTSWVRQTTAQDNLGFRKINRMTPMLVGDLVIQGNSIDGLVAYSREKGQEKWRLPIANGVEPSTALVNDRLFVAANDGVFYSIEASTGKIQWTFATKSENLSTPLLDNGNVYFLAGNNVFYALDAATGRQLWLYSRQDTSQFSIRGGSQAAINGDALFVGFSDGSLVALATKTGSVIWELQLNHNKRFRDVDATPIIDGNQLYVAGYDDRLYCISADKGEVLWRIDGGSYSGITLSADKLFYPTSGGEVWALKKSNGEKIWTYKINEGIATQVKVFKDTIVFGESQGKLRFLDPQTGKELGAIEPGRGVLSAPSVDEKKGRVYFISGEANLFAIEAGWVPVPHYKD